MMSFSVRIIGLFLIYVCSLSTAPAIASVKDCRVDFLEGKATAELFTSEKSEAYFSLLEPLDIAAKTGGRVDISDINDARNKTRQIYASSVLPFSEDEKKFLENAVGNVCRVLEGRFQGIVHRAWRLIKTEPYIEGGLPHTREDGIVFSSDMIHRMMNSPPAFTEMLLAHEILHVVQRQNRRLFAQFYTEAWGYRKVNAIKAVPDILVSNQVMNPDGVDYNWIIPGSTGEVWWWPRVLLKPEDDEAVSMPSDFHFVSVKIKEKNGSFYVVDGQNSFVDFQPLKKNHLLAAKFPGIKRPYHPDEVASKYFDKYYLALRFGKQDEIDMNSNQALSKLVQMLGSRF